jgi:hypothetical protein
MKNFMMLVAGCLLFPRFFHVGVGTSSPAKTRISPAKLKDTAESL